ncbi:MAG TPA: RnfABCDGE type electron transport complex subunit C, partial [bacterium]|nr:RnfABCDGE type electron transport complex subunit C [bacterium]
VGLGGATFPTHIKLNPPSDKKIDTIIINAVECEPYLTADYRLMLEHCNEIIEGAEILKYLMNIDNIVIGIEANKKDAFEIFKKYGQGKLQAELLKLKYPQGAEKQLIDAITNRKVPPAKLPMDVGVIVVNVGTVYAIYEATVYNKPLIERIVTVSGAGIKSPKNLRCRIGILWSEIIKYCGGISSARRLIMGGPMMGVAQFTDDVPVIKGVSGILALTDEEVGYSEEEPCLRCGNCIRGCPMNLLPSEINKMCDANDIEQLIKLNIVDCIECGSCVYVCPANKKILQKIRKYKLKVRR